MLGVSRAVLWAALGLVVVVGVVLVLVPAPVRQTALPGACPQLPRLPAPGLMTRGYQAGVESVSCSWDAPQSHVLPLLTAKLWLFHDGVETAARDAAEHRTRPQEAGNGTSPGADTSLAGVGDEAWVTDHGALIMVVARKANVVLTMEYAPRSRGGADQSDAVADARALLDLVTVG